MTGSREPRTPNIKKMFMVAHDAQDVVKAMLFVVIFLERKRQLKS